MLIVAHDAVILLFRYVCEGLGEDQLLAITKATTVTNASVTHLTRPSGQGFWKARTAGERADAVLIGPGLDEAEQTAELLELLLPVLRNETRVVLDAFALGVLDQVGAATKVAGRLVLTPNLAEAARLLGDKDREIEDLDRAVTEIAERFSAVVTCQCRCRCRRRAVGDLDRARRSWHLRKRGRPRWCADRTSGSRCRSGSGGLLGDASARRSRGPAHRAGRGGRIPGRRTGRRATDRVDRTRRLSRGSGRSAIRPFAPRPNAGGWCSWQQGRPSGPGQPVQGPPDPSSGAGPW